VREGREGQRVAGRLWPVVLGMVLAAGWILAGAGVQPATANTMSDRTRKADLLDHLGYAPRLIFVGGSRSLRFSPAYAQRRTGLRGFNAAVVECMNEDVWAMMHRVVKRDPQVRRRYMVWGIQPSTIFLTRRLDSALVRDRRLNSWFPRSLLRAQGSGLLHPVRTRIYSRDGGLTWDAFAAEAAAGVTLSHNLQPYIDRARRNPCTQDSISTKKTRGRRYFELTLKYLNAHQCEPLLILMPIHPKVLSVMRNDHWVSLHASLLAYFKTLQERYHFTVLDFTFIPRFNGDPEAFYDDVHMKASNLRRMVATAVRDAPWAFGKGAAPWDPVPTPPPTPVPSASPADSASPSVDAFPSPGGLE
jgi:hypothetical protein